ncbi:MFS transporter [Sulfolobus acidocaldarius]|uniref:Conserved membrane protein n=4 Tax=Sulfolobus acidocaldarius TaxID=2285 RepID=Q4JBW8_SULAC|nr:MFS transporter [Sulfolobus acidocaldarius]AAY79711.1 conserved membrane protein [Sulfolobus acidocaldarius DSM 639]AGE70270.1 hypothetical protein SacN8_01445 [Sulfolobus acidocaldarius N8]AGE72545.1 hypothetical protein SacRon12I_01445 [Sulfolobus acidocaldarius Ron12/I]ALU29328.1 MFS transporter [Sulfolobus acidocaldarius]ALU32057.1 MFS transporter [Sulfolobus acidocaldarius]
MIKPNVKWMYLVIPFNASTGPLSTLITLQILNLGGNAIEVAYTVSLGNLVLIIASMFWGYVADRFDRRKQILISTGGTSLPLFLMMMSRSIPLISLNYAFAVFMSTASTTPFNLLVMETTDKKHWGSLFSRYSLFSSIGVLVGLLISTFLITYLEISLIEGILAIISLSTFILCFRFIPKPQVSFERTSLIHNKESFFSRIRQIPLIFLHLPSIHSFKIFSLKRLKTPHVNYVPLLYIGLIIFYISSGIFNTVYPAGLYKRGLTENEVLLVTLVGMLIQIVGFQFSSRLLENRKEEKLAHLSLLLRGGNYIIIGLIMQFFVGIPVLLAGLTSYPLAAGIAYAIFYSSSTTLIFKILGGRHQGAGLGIYSTVVGVALFAGSLISGYITHYFSYGIDFMIAGVLLIICSRIFAYLSSQ